MKLASVKLTAVIAMLFVFGSVGCVINAGESSSGPLSPANDPELVTGEQPVMSQASSGTAYVDFAKVFGQPIEAWEVTTQMRETYFNYSRFPYGTTSYRGQSVQVCTAVVGLNKYVGISENSIRLKKAMMLVIRTQTNLSPSWFNCSSYEAMIAKDPNNAILDKVFDSL